MRRVGLTGRGVTLLLVGLACLVAGGAARYPGLTGAGIAAMVAVVVSALGLVTRRGLAVTRRLPTRPVRRLSGLIGELIVSGRPGAPGGELELVERVAGTTLAPQRLSVGSADTGIEYPVPTTLPGEVPIGPAELRWFGFAGLSRMRLTDPSTAVVTVLARSLPVRMPDSGVLPVDTARADEVEGGGTELRSLRPYTPGDDLRKVNGRISARVGRLMIRQDAEPSISAVNLVVDNVSGTDPETYAEMLDVATSVVGAAVHSALPISWVGRGREYPSSVDADGLPATELALACLPTTDDPLPRVAGSDLTVVVCGPEADPGELAQQLTEHTEHRVLVMLRLDRSAPTSTDTANRPDIGDAGSGGGVLRSGALLLQATTAEMVLRRLSGLDRGPVGALR